MGACQKLLLLLKLKPSCTVLKFSEGAQAMLCLLHGEVTAAEQLWTYKYHSSQHPTDNNNQAFGCFLIAAVVTLKQCLLQDSQLEMFIGRS